MMKTLQSFASPSRGVQIFRDADPLPLFFENNLVDPSRVVKHFANDPQANIRVFYYQYLKLCFELENVDFEGYIRRIEDLINNDEFKFIFYEEDDPELFSDLQFKQLIMEFFGLLGQGGIPLQQAINYYPVMDTVFIYFFRALLILTGRTDALDSYIDREELFQFLCSYFNVEISIHDRCIKFVDSDIFVYEEDPKDVYMAYMEDLEEEAQQGQEQTQYPQEQYPQEQYPQEQYPQEQYNQEQYQQHQYSQQQYSQRQQEENIHNEYGQGAQHSNFHPNYSHEKRQQEESYPEEKTEAVSLLRAENVSILKEEATPIHDMSYGSSGSQRGTSEINKSYISSEFVDYTQTSSNLHSMVKKDLKGSAEISKQPTFGKIIEQPAPLYKPPTPESPYESPLAVNSYLQPDNKYSSSYSNQYASEAKPPPATFSEYNGKPTSNHQETPFSKKAEETALIGKSWEAPPTKDPGFGKSITYEAYQPQGLPSKKYAQLLQNKFQYQKPASYASYEDKIEVKKPFSSFQPTKPASTYTPSSYTPTSVPSRPVPPPASVPAYKPSSPAPLQHAPYGQSGKSPFNLNVSLEFTNSFTMKAMAEPFRSNVRTIRSRARDYRNSLISFIK